MTKADKERIIRIIGTASGRIEAPPTVSFEDINMLKELLSNMNKFIKDNRHDLAPINAKLMKKMLLKG